MKTKRLTYLLSFTTLFSFLLALPSSIFGESRTGYDGAGNYIPDILIDEKESRKLIINRLESKRQELIEKIKKDPMNYLYHYHLGDVYLEIKRPANAIASFEEVIKLNPRNGKAHYQLAKAYTQINDISKAKRHLAIASQIFKANLDLHWQTKIDVFLLQLRE
jgi:tetratricopeptide (TPR) repeat protein